MVEYRHVQHDESVNVTKGNPLVVFAAAIAGLAIFITIVYAAALLLLELLLPTLGVGAERWIWTHVIQERLISEQQPASKETQHTQRYVQSLLDRIPKTGMPEHSYRIMIIEEPQVNALALPAGHIVVYRGLLDQLKSENALVFVLGHELGHFANRDHMRGLGQAVIAGVVLSLFSISDSGASYLFDSINTSVALFFSRQKESQADIYGLKALEHMYQHAGGADELFHIMQAHEQGNIMTSYMHTHPMPEERISALHQQAKDMGLPLQMVVPLPVLKKPVVLSE